MKLFRTVLLCLALLPLCQAFGSDFEIYLVRHFEKQKNVTNPALTEQGALRAEKLVKVLKSVDLQGVFSTDYRRTQQTALPTAQSKSLVVTLYDPSDLRQFVEKVKDLKKNVLIVGHSNTTPAVIKLLGGQSKPISEDDYGELFKLTFEGESVSTQSQMVSLKH